MVSDLASAHRRTRADFRISSGASRLTLEAPVCFKVRKAEEVADPTKLDGPRGYLYRRVEAWDRLWAGSNLRRMTVLEVLQRRHGKLGARSHQ